MIKIEVNKIGINGILSYLSKYFLISLFLIMKGNEKKDPAPHKRIEKCESALMKFRFENRNVIFRLAIYFVIFVAVLPYKSSAY